MTDVGYEENADFMRISWKTANSWEPEKGLTRRVLAQNPRLMLVEHRMTFDWVGARHSHPHDQAVYVVSGKLRFSVGDHLFEAAAGDSFVVRGGIEHQAWAIEESVVVDAFTPTREDYLQR